MQYRSYAKRQQGSVLLWGLVILLVMTVVGVAASRMSNTDNKIAGNQMMYMMAQQGADSMLRQSASLYSVQKTAQSSEAVPADAEAGVVRVRTLDGVDTYVDAANGTTVEGESRMGSTEGCPPLAGVAMTTEMNPDTGGLACRTFSTEVNASVPGTGARNTSAEGVVKPVPPSS